MEHIEYVYTLGMTDAEIEERLWEHDAGVLGLANDGRAYVVPVSYYYDGDRGSVFFRLGDDDHSRKLEFVTTTEEASFLIYGVEAPGASWSVLTTGRLQELPEAERAEFDPETVNERFGPLRVFDEAIDGIDLVFYELDVTSIVGRRTTV